MKSLKYLCAAILLSACTESAEPPQTEAPHLAATDSVSGEVVELIDVGNYLYLRVGSEKDSLWLAANPGDIKVGDSITATGAMAMNNFHSSALDRTFEEVLFVESVVVDRHDDTAGSIPKDEAHALPEGHPVVTEPAPNSSQAAVAILPEAGTMTVAEIYAAHPGIDGQQVAVRGEVIKFSTAIMGANWVTLQDGTGTEPDNILVAKTQETVEIGETVTVTGTVKADVSLGYGYDYKVLVEDSRILR